MDHNSRRFWMPASNYYILSVAACGVVFFVVWGALNDLGDPTPWVYAGIAASVGLMGAVVFREFILRRARSRELREVRLREERMRLSRRVSLADRAAKLTIEENALLLSEIRQKSDAARLLNRLAAGHKEVFEICTEYLGLIERELKTISPNSPRLAPLLKGRSFASEVHRSHLLKWAEIESRALTAQASGRTLTAERVESAQAALRVIETGLEFYPQEADLLESRSVLAGLVVSIKVSKLIERAERAGRKGDPERARELYETAIEQLEKDDDEAAAAVLINHLRQTVELLRTIRRDDIDLSERPAD